MHGIWAYFSNFSRLWAFFWRIRICIRVITQIRIRINVMRIHNTGSFKPGRMVPAQWAPGEEAVADQGEGGGRGGQEAHGGARQQHSVRDHQQGQPLRDPRLLVHFVPAAIYTHHRLRRGRLLVCGGRRRCCLAGYLSGYNSVFVGCIIALIWSAYGRE